MFQIGIALKHQHIEGAGVTWIALVPFVSGRQRVTFHTVMRRMKPYSDIVYLAEDGARWAQACSDQQLPARYTRVSIDQLGSKHPRQVLVMLGGTTTRRLFDGKEHAETAEEEMRLREVVMVCGVLPDSAGGTLDERTVVFRPSSSWPAFADSVCK